MKVRLWRALLLTLLFAIHKNSFAQLDPSIDWRVLSTPHFRIVHDAKYRPLAELYARYAEQSREVLLPLFKEAPDVVTILIDDSTDYSNGMATSFPFPFIRVHPVFPSHADSIGQYGNWGYELTLHELGHIYTFEPTNGWMKPFRWLFGSLGRPNFLLPRWYHEGVSVNLESYYSVGGGRLRSPEYLAHIRAMVEGGILERESLARINEAVPDWLGGKRPYLLGGLLVHSILNQSEEEGVDGIYHLTQAYSRRVPFFLNGPVERMTQKDLGKNLESMFSDLRAQVEKQNQKIQSEPSIEGIAIGPGAREAHSPSISPNGRFLAFVAENHRGESQIHVLKAVEKDGFANSKSLRVYSGERVTKISWAPDSESFVFDDTKEYRRYYSYSDLYLFETESRKIRRLTRGLRATEPSFSPDGKQILFRQNYEYGTRIARINRNGENFEVIYEPPRQNRVSHPEYLSADTYTLTERDSSGREAILVTKIGEVPRREVAPALSPVGPIRRTSLGLIAQSSFSGVPNLYLVNKSFSQTRALTNVRTGVINGDVDPITKDLYYTRLTAEGARIYRLKADEWRQNPVVPPKIEPMVQMKWPNQPPPDLSVRPEDKKYSSLPYLLPRYWIPGIFAVEEGWLFQASTGASDPVGNHSYSILASFDTLTEKMSASASYTNQQTPMAITLFGGQFNQYIYTANGSIRTTDVLSLTSSFFLPGLSSSWRGALGISRTEISEPESLLRAGPGASISYSSASQKGEEISPGSGFAFQLGHSEYLESMGTKAYSESNLSMNTYFSRWLPRLHAISLATNVTHAPGITITDATELRALGTTTLSGNYQASVVGSDHLLRGYPSGVFLGRSLATVNLEYRFPISAAYKGWGTLPIFLRRHHAAVFVDALAFDGARFDFEVEGYFREEYETTFMSTGVELRSDLTLGYAMPAQLRLGLYYGFDLPSGGGFSPFISLLF